MAKTRAQLPHLYYPSDMQQTRILNAHAFGGGGVGADLTTDLVHYWDLDSTVATLTDQHGALDLTREGTVNTNATGAPDGGSCVEMNLTGLTFGCFTGASTAKLATFDTAFSVNIWAYTVSDPTYGAWAISHRAAFNPRYFQIYTRSDTSQDIGTLANSATLINAAAAEEAVNTWQMLTLVRDGADFSLLRNGTTVATATYSGTPNTGSAPFRIGAAAWDTFGGGAFRGRLFAAGIWGAALDASQISALYNGGAGLRYSAL